ncbi:hypothetical protein [Bartonella vinsonii]|uniref:hypothetical protein n=1 Tax=Bartonella vinsonii TaxID=33047 RepID=UPI0012DE7695|nr:hypothetical protein [Bartonella vinsonii]
MVKTHLSMIKIRTGSAIEGISGSMGVGMSGGGFIMNASRGVGSNMRGMVGANRSIYAS